MDSVNVSTPYDDVFKTLLNDCTEFVIPLVNEVFGEDYAGNEPIQFLQNEHFMNQPDAATKEKITDSCFVIHGKIDKKYHIECQSTPDGSMIIRMFEYDSQIALDSGEINGYVLTVTFPNSAVLYLRHTSKTPDKMIIKIITPGGEISYPIPVLKVQRYSIDEIFEKELYFLIPFFIFSYEKSLAEYDSNAGKLQELENVYLKIREKMENLCSHGKLSEYEKRVIIDLSKKVLEHIAVHYNNVKEGVKDAMGGKILDYEAKDILNRGKAEGRAEGLIQGKLEVYIDLIRDGLLNISEAAKRLNMEETELKKYL